MPTRIDGDVWSEGNAIHCPYCNAATMDAADAGTWDDTFEVQCDECKRAFAVERVVSVEFVSRPLPVPAQQMTLPMDMEE